jgi:hypothetical protein
MHKKAYIFSLYVNDHGMYFFSFIVNNLWLIGRSVKLRGNISYKNFNHRHIITLIVCYIFIKTMSNVLSVAFICLHIVYDFVESNVYSFCLPPCSQVVDGCQHQQLIVVCLFVFFHLPILLHVLLRFAAFNYQVW